MESVLTNDKYSVRMILTENERNGGKSNDFFYYIKNLKILKNVKELRDMLILSETHHFYYDYEELKNVKLIMNARKMNNIEKIDDFMSGLLENMASGSYFCGSFINNKFSFSSNNRFDLFLNTFKSHIDFPRKTKLFSVENIYFLFSRYDFKIIDMREINGVTYFSARKNG